MVPNLKPLLLLVAVRAVGAGLLLSAAASGQFLDGRPELQSRAELHVEPLREVLLGEQGERGAVYALVAKRL